MTATVSRSTVKKKATKPKKKELPRAVRLQPRLPERATAGLSPRGSRSSVESVASNSYRARPVTCCSTSAENKSEADALKGRAN